MHYDKEGEGANLWNDKAVFLKLSSSKQLRNVTFIFLHNWSTLKNPNKCAWKSDKWLFMDLFFFWITLVFHRLWLIMVQLYVLHFLLRISWYKIIHSLYLKCKFCYNVSNIISESKGNTNNSATLVPAKVITFIILHLRVTQNLDKKKGRVSFLDSTHLLLPFPQFCFIYVTEEPWFPAGYLILPGKIRILFIYSLQCCTFMAPSTTVIEKTDDCLQFCNTFRRRNWSKKSGVYCPGQLF